MDRPATTVPPPRSGFRPRCRALPAVVAPRQPAGPGPIALHLPRRCCGQLRADLVGLQPRERRAHLQPYRIAFALRQNEPLDHVQGGSVRPRARHGLQRRRAVSDRQRRPVGGQEAAVQRPPLVRHGRIHPHRAPVLRARRDEDVIEDDGRRQTFRDHMAPFRVHQRGPGLDPRGAQQRDEQNRLVLAIAEPPPRHFRQRIGCVRRDRPSAGGRPTRVRSRRATARPRGTAATPTPRPRPSPRTR